MRAELRCEKDGRTFTVPCTIEREWQDPATLAHRVILRCDLLDQFEAKEKKMERHPAFRREGDGLDGFRQLLADFPEWGDWRQVHR